MKTVGSPVESSLLQAAQAQQVASKTRYRERLSDASARLPEEHVERQVRNAQTSEAIRHLPKNASEYANTEHHVLPHLPADSPDCPRIDLIA